MDSDCTWLVKQSACFSWIVWTFVPLRTGLASILYWAYALKLQVLGYVYVTFDREPDASRSLLTVLAPHRVYVCAHGCMVYISESFIYMISMYILNTTPRGTCCLLLAIWFHNLLLPTPVKWIHYIVFPCAFVLNSLPLFAVWMLLSLFIVLCMHYSSLPTA